MKPFKLKTYLTATASAALLSSMLTAPTFAQSSADAVEDEIITLGTRRTARSAADAPAPVDVISGAELIGQASNDVSDLIRVSVPSYNVNAQPISDAATVVRPANLRGLAPDNTLVLLNGKRRHRASVIAFLGGGIADGSQGADISVFPALGLKQVEVLRDGASSQYGADAIAGVMNFQLKDAAEGGSIEVKYGSTYEGDGDNYRIAGNVGLPLGDKGFVNLSAEYGEADDTIRSVQRADATALIAAGNTAVTDISVNTVTEEFTQVWGQPNVNDDFKFFVNTGLELSDNVEVYAFGNYAERQVEGGFYYRNPTNRGGVFEGPVLDANDFDSVLSLNDNGTPDNEDDDFFENANNVRIDDTVNSVLVGNLAGVDPNACPAGIPLTGGNGLIMDPAILAQVTGSANCFSFVEIAPGGFTPRFGGNNEDMSVVAGIRGELGIGTGLGYDVSYTYGSNKTEFFINNTVNASLGPDTPRNFRPGAYQQTDNNFNLDLTYGIPVAGFASDLNLAAGFEFREEEFRIFQGDDASFAIGPLARPTPGFQTGQGFSSSSNGFGGFVPAAAGANSQENIAFYGEVEADVTDRITLLAAGRWEDFDTFGDTFNWKVGGLFKVTDNMRLRGTYSTGFHAPTPGQANVINVTTSFTNGRLVDVGTIPITSGAGQFINSRRANPFTLGPEESKNISLGVGFDVGRANITIDYFNIDLDGRIALTDNIDFIGELRAFAAENNVDVSALNSTSQIINALNGVGGFNSADFAGSEDLTSFTVFTNNFDTKTQGIDVVANMPFDVGQGSSSVTTAFNWTETEVNNPGTQSPLGSFRIRSLEENIPSFKGNVTLNHSQGIFSGFLRANYHSDYFEDHLGPDGFPIEPGSEIILDAELSAEFIDGVVVSVGAANLLDNNPDEVPDDSNDFGTLYPATAPFGFNGGQYYVRARIDF